MSSDPLHPTIVRQLEREQRADQAKASARAAHPAGRGDMNRTYTQLVNDLLDLVGETSPDAHDLCTTAEDYGNIEVMAEKIATKAGIDRRRAALDEADQ